MNQYAIQELTVTPSSDQFTVRTMNEADVQLVVDWAAAEGWNPGLHDAAAFYRADPRGFFIGEIDGEPVGAMSAVRYPEAFAFIGLFIVRPEFRGPGFGTRIAKIAMRHIEGALVGVDGVFEKEASYQKFGFKTAHKSYRFEYRCDRSFASHLTGNIADDPKWLAEAANKCGEGKWIDQSMKSNPPNAIGLSGKEFHRVPKSIRRADQVSFDAIARYDRTCFPSSREGFLRQWLQMPQSKSLVMVDRGKLQGMGTIRTCLEGYKIGPLFADDAGRAAELFFALADYADPDLPIYIDMPEINEPAMRFAESLGMHQVFGTARMYNGPAPDIQLDRIFGITTFELG